MPHSSWTAPKRQGRMTEIRIGVVGATGAVGRVTLALLAERGFEQVRAFASSRSAGAKVPYGDDELEVEEAMPEALAAGDLDLCFFSVGSGPSSELVPAAVRGGAVCVDKSSAFRLTDGVPLVVPEVNGERATAHDGIVANPNCSTIQLVCALAPLHQAAGLRRVRVATYQSASGAGADRMKRLQEQTAADGDVVMDWDFDGEESLSPERARELLEAASGVRVTERPTARRCRRRRGARRADPPRHGGRGAR